MTTRSAPRTVVGAVIVDALDRPTAVLAARRNRPADLAGRWEFPGGKVEPGETPQAALVREVREELDVAITVGDELVGPAGGWPISAGYVLRLFFAVAAGGTISPGSDHDEVRWLAAAELDSVDWLPSDRGAVAVLRTHLESLAG
ncbi:MAG TPA: (deoxy)nucleoside triphosphate pyrophosphohydrolase [Nocardioides sp.]|nr:(deoxy)nucleoside triphosphate pyrophosphohydrolase [Nocardioides sp.]